MLSVELAWKDANWVHIRFMSPYLYARRREAISRIVPCRVIIPSFCLESEERGGGVKKRRKGEKKKPRFSRLKRAAASRRPRHSLFRSWLLGSGTPFPQGKQRQEAASSRCTLSHLTRRPPVRLCLPKDVSASPPRATRCRPDRPPCPPSGPHREPSASACRRGPRGPIPSRAKKPFPSPLWADYGVHRCNIHRTGRHARESAIEKKAAPPSRSHSS
ncbi:hypothetical protein LY78DRAFT_166315 [Colletotrichum sublineola]|nr:hypothetical protein LY78DRAFT_166315 [Colletotrichum sublineola]